MRLLLVLFSYSLEILKFFEISIPSHGRRLEKLHVFGTPFFKCKKWKISLDNI